MNEFFSIKDWILQVKRLDWQIKNQLITNERITEFLFGSALDDSEHLSAYNALAENDRKLISEYSPGGIITEDVLNAFWNYCREIPAKNYVKEYPRTIRKIQPFLSNKDMVTLSEFEKAERVAEMLLERRKNLGGK